MGKADKSSIRDPKRVTPAKTEPRAFVRAADLLDPAFVAASAGVASPREPHVMLDAYGRILGLSPSVSEFLGFDERKLIGRRLVYRVLGTERGKLLKALLALRTHGTFESVTIRFHRKNGADTDVVLAPASVVPGPRGTLVVVCKLRFASAQHAEACDTIESADSQ